MGFFKFLKRDRKKELDELDLPPEPPPIEEFEQNLPEFPDFEEKISAPKEEMPNFGMPEIAPMESEEQQFGKEEFPSFPELEDKVPMPISTAPLPAETPLQMPAPVTAPLQEAFQQPTTVQEVKPIMPAEAYPKIERRLFTQERRALREMPSGKTIYLRVDRFKASLGNINTVRSDLRKSEATIAKLESIKSAKDSSLDRARAQLEDLQKKLIFIDKTLFKGDKNEGF